MEVEKVKRMYETNLGNVVVKNLSCHPDFGDSIETVLTGLRKRETKLGSYRDLTKVFYETYVFPQFLGILPTTDVKITTGNNCSYWGKVFDSCNVLIIDIPRAGTLPSELLVDYLLRIFNATGSSVNVYKGVIDEKRIEGPHGVKIDVGRSTLPEIDKNVYLFIPDPMLATENTVSTALEIILNKYSVKSVGIGSLIAAVEDIRNVVSVLNMYDARSKIIVGAIDQRLDHKYYIQPGLGDAGDRTYYS